jgi:hypothetical protein
MFSPLAGVAMRIRRIALADLKNSALVDGRALITADTGSRSTTWNASGCAVGRTARRCSRSSSSMIQRTLLSSRWD